VNSYIPANNNGQYPTTLKEKFNSQAIMNQKAPIELQKSMEVP